MVETTWKDSEKVSEYVGRMDRLSARAAGEAELVEVLPPTVDRLLDLGCGDGRLIELVLSARPGVGRAVGLDNSPPMLQLASQRFGGDDRVAITEHDLGQALPELDPFDLVVSGFAIHHLSDERKRLLFAEIAEILAPGGTFANLEVVQCATPELQAEFLRRIERPDGDPEDALAEIEPQLGWMRDAGLTQVDCYWRWRGFALLVGRAPISR